MKEYWKEVFGFDRYEASNMGRLRSKPRTWVKKYRGGEDRKGRTSGRILSPAMDKCGYMRTMIHNGDRYVTVKLHRIVLQTFTPRDDYKSMEVNHMNGVKHDNRVENLQWCTRSENIKHSFETGLQDNFLNGTLKRNRERRRLSFDKFASLMDDYNRGIKAPTLAKLYGINKKTTYQIVKGITYRDFHKDYKTERGYKADSC